MDRRKEAFVRQIGLAPVSSLDNAGLGYAEAARPRQGQHMRLIGSGPIRRQVGERTTSVSKCRAVLQHGLDRRVGNRQQEIDALGTHDVRELHRVRRGLG